MPLITIVDDIQNNFGRLEASRTNATNFAPTGNFAMIITQKLPRLIAFLKLALCSIVR